MYELEFIDYLEKKVKFGDMKTDLRWENFSDIFIRECKKASLIIDCGAEFGFYIHLVIKNNPNCRIIAYEPEPPRFEALKNYFSSNSLIQIHPYAVSNENGVVNIYKADGKSASMDKNLTQWGAVDNSAIEVPCRILDDMLASDIPDIIKMDIEGAEVFAFEGLKQILAAKKTIIFLEYHKQFVEAMKNGGTKELLQILTDNDYNIYNCYGKQCPITKARVILATEEQAKDIVFDKEKPCFISDTSKHNKRFSHEYSLFFNSINNIIDSRLIIYGVGSTGQTVASLLSEKNIVAIVDKNSSQLNQNKSLQYKILAPYSIPNLDYDYIFICVLGREDEISSFLIEEIGVPKEKILVFQFANGIIPLD